MPYRFNATLRCDNQVLGTFPYLFTTDDEYSNINTQNQISLFPFHYFNKQLTLPAMIKKYKYDLLSGRTTSIHNFHSSEIVYATLIKRKIESNCPHFVSHSSLFCNTCQTSHSCIYCHNDTDCLEFSCDLIRCELCKTDQKLGQTCIQCKAKLAEYSCLQCCIFVDNSDEFPIFHCDQENKCIKGNQNDFIHCNKCNKCVEKQFYSVHSCIPQEEDLCCVCHGEFDQLVNFKVMFKCKHYMHSWCWKQVGDKCPLCSKPLLLMKSDREADLQKFAEVLKSRSLGSVNDISNFECNVCGTNFQDYFPGCCCQPFCRSCDLAENAQGDNIISYKEAQQLLQLGGMTSFIIYQNQEQIKEIFRTVLEKQNFWSQYLSECSCLITLFLDFCNLDDSETVWQAVCLLLNKGYTEIDVHAGIGLNREVQACLEQLQQ